MKVFSRHNVRSREAVPQRWRTIAIALVPSLLLLSHHAPAADADADADWAARAGGSGVVAAVNFDNPGEWLSRVYEVDRCNAREDACSKRMPTVPFTSG